MTAAKNGNMSSVLAAVDKISLNESSLAPGKHSQTDAYQIALNRLCAKANASEIKATQANLQRKKRRRQREDSLDPEEVETELRSLYDDKGGRESRRASKANVSEIGQDEPFIWSEMVGKYAAELAVIPDDDHESLRHVYRKLARARCEEGAEPYLCENRACNHKEGEHWVKASKEGLEREAEKAAAARQLQQKKISGIVLITQI